MQCIKPDEKACNQEQEMVHVQTEQSLSHEKVDSVTQCNCRTNGPGSQAQVDQKKNHEKNEKKMKDKKGKKAKKEKEKKGKKAKKEKEKKGKKENDKKKERRGDRKK
ncbi:hypothetical protein D5086_000828 [Populus alba]|uniref:Uncharacterized protein n=3 Tax=Populus TaxID=3689 RepID=A0A4U5PMF4_POPAL|nr:hypothetical protein NC653_001070 [Populus alba x Populus x berolinensis]TKR97586.1 hypothetical protein D5086_0000212310 [Populus alba]